MIFVAFLNRRKVFQSRNPGCYCLNTVFSFVSKWQLGLSLYHFIIGKNEKKVLLFYLQLNHVLRMLTTQDARSVYKYGTSFQNLLSSGSRLYWHNFRFKSYWRAHDPNGCVTSYELPAYELCTTLVHTEMFSTDESKPIREYWWDRSDDGSWMSSFLSVWLISSSSSISLVSPHYSLQ